MHGISETSLGKADFYVLNGDEWIANDALDTVAAIGADTGNGNVGVYVFTAHGRWRVSPTHLEGSRAPKVVGVSADGHVVAWMGREQRGVRLYTGLFWFGLKMREQSFDPGGEMTRFTFAPTGHRWLCQIKTDSEGWVMTDGIDSPHYLGTIAAQFDSTGRHLGVLALRSGDDNTVFALDGVQQSTWNGGTMAGLAQAVVAGHAVWVYVQAQTEGPVRLANSGKLDPDVKPTFRVMIGGNAGKWYKEIGNLVLSANKAHLMYAAKRQDDSWVLVRDAWESELGPDSHEEPVAIALSGDGGKAFWVVDRGQDGMVVFRDGSIVGHHMKIGALAFSRNGSAYTYAASDRDGVWQVFVGNAPLDRFDAVSSLIMSSDGAHVAYFGVKGKSEVLVRDRERSRNFTGHPAGLNIVEADGVFRAITFAERSGTFELTRVQWYP
jgi:hypothetical protein